MNNEKLKKNASKANYYRLPINLRKRSDKRLRETVQGWINDPDFSILNVLQSKF